MTRSLATDPGLPRTRGRLRLLLPVRLAVALERRADREDRYPHVEAARIIRERLVADGDYTPTDEELS